MITTLVTLVMFFISANANADSKSSAPQPAPHSINQASETKFRWGEVVPNYAVQLTFAFLNCANEPTTPRIAADDTRMTHYFITMGKRISSERPEIKSTFKKTRINA